MSKAKHRADRAKSSFRIQRHYILNQWNYFKKPKLKKAIKRLFGKA